MASRLETGAWAGDRAATLPQTALAAHAVVSVILALLLVARVAAAAPPEVEAARRRLLGATGRPFPSEFTDNGGMMLDNEGTSLGLFATSDAHFFAIQRSVSADGARHASWENVDVLAVPEPPAGQTLWEEYCQLDGEVGDQFGNPHVIAIAVDGSQPNWSGKVLHAWRADLNTRRWIEVPGERVRCGTDDDVD